MIVKKGEWKNSIDVLISSKEINFYNLFLSLKNLTKEEFIVLKIYVISYNENEEIRKKTPIFGSVSKRKIQKLSSEEFEDWFENILESNENYTKVCNLVGFRIIYFEDSLIWDFF